MCAQREGKREQSISIDVKDTLRSFACACHPHMALYEQARVPQPLPFPLQNSGPATPNGV